MEPKPKNAGTCPICKGSGLMSYRITKDESDVEPCSECEGKGWIKIMEKINE